uniref:Uncharacterized protein n=1 Tax=Arundo donax TaxID=35708 RepID=A0A0A9A0D8_ARUDO
MKKTTVLFLLLCVFFGRFQGKEMKAKYLVI